MFWVVDCGWENPGTKTCHDVSNGSHTICSQELVCKNFKCM